MLKIKLSNLYFLIFLKSLKNYLMKWNLFQCGLLGSIIINSKLPVNKSTIFPLNPNKTLFSNLLTVDTEALACLISHSDIITYFFNSIWELNPHCIFYGCKEDLWSSDTFNNLSYYKRIHKRPNDKSLENSGLFSKNEKLYKHPIISGLGLHNVLPLIRLK